MFCYYRLFWCLVLLSVLLLALCMRWVVSVQFGKLLEREEELTFLSKFFLCYVWTRGTYISLLRFKLRNWFIITQDKGKIQELIIQIKVNIFSIQNPLYLSYLFMFPPPPQFVHWYLKTYILGMKENYRTNLSPIKHIF